MNPKYQVGQEVWLICFDYSSEQLNPKYKTEKHIIEGIGPGANIHYNLPGESVEYILDNDCYSNEYELYSTEEELIRCLNPNFSPRVFLTGKGCYFGELKFWEREQKLKRILE